MHHSGREWVKEKRKVMQLFTNDETTRRYLEVITDSRKRVDDNNFSESEGTCRI